MTTANRPTWNPAVGSVGGHNNVSFHISAKDQPSHMTLKYRQVGQSSAEEMISKDLRTELNHKEDNYVAAKNRNSVSLIENEEKSVDVLKLITNKPDITSVKGKYNDEDADVEDGNSDRDLESSDEDDDDEDDELELQRELLRIKSERATQQSKKEAEEREEMERMKTESAVKGNPLLDLDGSGDSKIKRKWNDDVVFRNQTKNEPESKKRFINDTIRNDFHRSFLKKFML